MKIVLSNAGADENKIDNKKKSFYALMTASRSEARIKIFKTRRVPAGKSTETENFFRTIREFIKNKLKRIENVFKNLKTVWT